MSKYQFMVKINQDLIRRMYQDHGYTADEICMRLRYPVDKVEEVVEKLGLHHGEKSWRY